MKNQAKMEGEPVLLFENKSVDSSAATELLTVAQAAKLLCISATGVRRLQQGRRIPFIKVGGSVRFLKSDLHAYIAKRRVEAIE